MVLRCNSCGAHVESVAAPPFAQCRQCGSTNMVAPAGVPQAPNWGAPPGGAAWGGPPGAWGQGAAPVGGQPPLDVQLLMIAAIVELAFCCQPAGIVALVMLNDAKRLHAQGSVAEAQSKLGIARMALVAGPFLGCALIALYVLATMAHVIR